MVRRLKVMMGCRLVRGGGVVMMLVRWVLRGLSHV
jgi:hypothetical protein